MPRHRALKAVLILLALATVGYVMISLYLPSSRRLTFGVDRTSGRIRRVQQNITFLPVHQFRRISFERRGEFARHSGIVRITSRESVPVLIAYRMRFTIEAERISDAERLIRDGWSEWIGVRVGEAVSAVASQVPIEELASPLSEFRSRRGRVRQIVAQHLARSGVRVTGFEIERIDVDRNALLSLKRAELRRNARGAFVRVVHISIEGADWELISALVEDKRLPNVEALLDSGAAGNLQTIQPTVAPLLAATMVTGVPPDRHGVLDFTDPRANSPALSSTRRVPALWDIANAFGRSAAVVNWWTAWPPTSDDIAVISSPFQSPDALLVHPPGFAQHARSVSVGVNTVGYRQLARFVNITEAEFNRASAQGTADDPVVILRGVLAKTWSDHRAGIDLYRSRRPMLLYVNFDGTDVVNHLFAPYHPPYREGIASHEFRRFGPTVANYYAEIDRLVGEWMQAIAASGEPTTVIITSQHGFDWGKGRPRTPPSGSGALATHRSPGIFIVWGANVVHDPLRRTISIYDVAPTTLALLGLPKSTEMPGRVLIDMFRNLEPVTGVAIASYADLVSLAKPNARAEGRLVDYRTHLLRIGHLTDPRRVAMPLLEEAREGVGGKVSLETWGRYAYLNNQGVQLRQQKKLVEASDAFAQAIALNPTRATPYLNLSIVLLERRQFTAADAVLMKAVARGLPTPERYVIDLAAYYRANDMPSRAVSFLLEARKVFPQSYEVAAALGSGLAAGGRYAEAIPELERALGMRPSSTRVLNNLGNIYARREEYGRALDYWNRSLAIDAAQPKIREAVEAARTNL
jgi:predicted AlkP superfamily phosphohydrolase/phosphomutase/Tfp pilus assembly protein PilF